MGMRSASRRNIDRFAESTHRAIRLLFLLWRMAWANRDTAQSRSSHYSRKAQPLPGPLDPIPERRCLQDPPLRETRFEKIRIRYTQPTAGWNSEAWREPGRKAGFFLEHARSTR